MSDTTANSNIDNTKQKLAWVTMAVGFGDKIGQDDNGKPLVLNFAVPVDLSSGFLLKNQQLASNADLEQLISQADVSVTQLFQVAKLGVYEQLLKERVALHNISADALMKVKTRSSRPQEGNVQIEFPEGRLELSVHNSLRNLQSPRTLITPHSMRLDLVKVALEAISFDKATLLLNQIYRRPSDKQFAKSTLEDTVHRMGLELYHKLIAQKDAFLAQHVLNACQAEDYAAIAEHVLSAEGSALTTATTAASATPEADSAAPTATTAAAASPAATAIDSATSTATMAVAAMPAATAIDSATPIATMAVAAPPAATAIDSATSTATTAVLASPPVAAATTTLPAITRAIPWNIREVPVDPLDTLDLKRVLHKQELEVPYEVVEQCLKEMRATTSVYYPADGVSVRQQKSGHLPHSKVVRDSKRFTLYTGLVRSNGHSYMIAAENMEQMFDIGRAHILAQYGHQDQTVTLTLFTDGECKLQDTGASMLDSASFYQFLDWYHIQHNVITLLKQALKGDREDSNKKEFIRSVLDNLWYGNPDLALIRLKQVDKACIKNSQALERIITYIINKSRYMTHYAARAFLGLPVSSCLGEMTNNVLVSSRQKLDNSASWTKHGSLALATLEALDRNGFLEALLANEPVNLLTNHAMTELPTAA